MRTLYSSSVFEFKKFDERKVNLLLFFGGFLRCWIQKSNNREDSLTAPSFRVLYETLNTRVKKSESERERAKRKDQNASVFSFFTPKARRKKKGTRLALFFLSRASLWEHTFCRLCTNLHPRVKEQQKRRDFETTQREKSEIRWCSFCPAMVALFHPRRRRVLFYHHQWEEREE